jgi:hypothetical protein
MGFSLMRVVLVLRLSVARGNPGYSRRTLPITLPAILANVYPRRRHRLNRLERSDFVHWPTGRVALIDRPRSKLGYKPTVVKFSPVTFRL